MSNPALLFINLTAKEQISKVYDNETGFFQYPGFVGEIGNTNLIAYALRYNLYVIDKSTF